MMMVMAVTMMMIGMVTMETGDDRSYDRDDGDDIMMTLMPGMYILGCRKQTALTEGPGGAK